MSSDRFLFSFFIPNFNFKDSGITSIRSEQVRTNLVLSRLIGQKEEKHLYKGKLERSFIKWQLFQENRS